MMQLTNQKGYWLVLTSSLLSSILTACSTPAQEPEPVAHYEVTDIRYLMTAQDRIDTASVSLKGVSVPNAGTTMTTQQVELKTDELIKASQFVIDSAVVLPTGVDFSKLAVNVPDGSWHGTSLTHISYFSELFPLSSERQEKPYGAYAKQTFTLSVPPKSRINISRQIDAYRINCTFRATLTNVTTGERHALTGKWIGTLGYNNINATLTESAL